MDRFRPWLRSVWLWLLVVGIAVAVFIIAAAPRCTHCW
jgi:hypothetical protein